MSKKIINKVVDETVDTIIDKIDEVLVDYMFDYGKYEETNDKFFNDKEDMFVQVIKELNNRINNNK
jgi:aspartyl-tRNA synthetase